MTALFTIRQSTDGFDLPDIISGNYEEAQIEFDKKPMFHLNVPNISGIEMYRLTAGKEIEIRRAGALGITGIIDIPTGEQGEGLSKVDLKGIHKGYAMLEAFECQDWSFAEGYASTSLTTVKNAVVMNPWDWFIFRAPNGTLGVDNLPPAVDGVPFEDAFKCLIGTKAVWQMDFQDNSVFMPSQINAVANTVQVFRDGPQSQTRAALQRVRNGATFKTGVAIESIPWQQNSPDCSVMGTVSTVSVIFIGKRDAASNNITVDVCRNASAGLGSRTYTNVPLTFTANSPVTGLDKWVGSITISGAEAVKNSLGFRVNIAGGATATSTYVYYGRIGAVVTSETGIAEGTIATYANPSTFGGNGYNFIETNVQGDNRVKAIEKIRQQTVSDSAVNPNPHWDCWVDGALAFHFSQRRGSAITKTYSFPEGNLRKISHKYDGTQIAYQTVAIGSGSGSAANAIKVRGDTTLYTAANDWIANPSTATYGKLAKQLSFIDSGESSMVTLYRKAQAFHKLHKAPIEKIDIKITAEHITYFGTGDSITIDNLNTRTAAATRVIYVKRSFSGDDREKLDVTLGQPDVTMFDHQAGSSGAAKEIVIRNLPADAAQGLAGNGIYFDKDHYGVYSLNIPEGANVERVALRLATQPWQATSKAASSVTVPNVVLLYQAIGAPNIAPSSYNQSIVDTSIAGGQSQVVADWEAFDIHALAIVQQKSVGCTYIFELRDQSNFWAAVKALTPYSEDSTVFDNSKFTISSKSLTGIFGMTSITGARISIYNDDTLYTATATGLVEVRGVPRHSHNLTFGSFQFNSDTDTTGTAAPTYGTGILLAVDPTVDANGIPTTFATQKHPQVFSGSQTAPQDMDIDITGYLTAEANGLIKSGIHKVYFLGAADTSVRANSLGLSVVSVTPQMTYRSGV